MNLVGHAHARLIAERRTRILAQHLDELLPTGRNVIDVGCGDGLVAHRLLERRTDLTVEGFDVALRPQSHIPIQKFDGVTLPVATDSADYVLLIDVLHHSPQPEALLRECARAAREGLVIKDHLCDGPVDRSILKLMDWVGNAPHGVALPYNYLSRDRWREIIAGCELRIDVWVERVDIYPKPLSWLFGRKLHLVTRLLLT